MFYHTAQDERKVYTEFNLATLPRIDNFIELYMSDL